MNIFCDWMKYSLFVQVSGWNRTLSKFFPPPPQIMLYLSTTNTWELAILQHTLHPHKKNHYILFLEYGSYFFPQTGTLRSSYTLSGNLLSFLKHAGIFPSSMRLVLFCSTAARWRDRKTTIAFMYELPLC